MKFFMTIKIKILKISTSSNKITNNLFDSSNTQNDNTFNNYTFSEVSNDTIISNDACDIFDISLYETICQRYFKLFCIR